MKLSIITINYNLADEVASCIESILKLDDAESNFDFEIIVVDNNSPDRIIEKICNQLSSQFSKKLKFYFSKENKGFGGGNNFGAKRASGEYILFLNPDTEFITDTLKNLFDLFYENEQFDVVGLKILREDGSPEISFGKFPTIFSEILILFNLSQSYKRYFYNKTVSDSVSKLVEVDWVTGSAILVNRNSFDSVEGFDENIFMYHDEVDLCKRIKNRGGKVYFYKNASVIHAGSLSSKKNYYFFTKTSYESKLYYLKKHFKGIKVILLLCLFLLQIITQLIFWTLLLPFKKSKAQGKIKGFWEITKSFFRF